MSVVRKARKFSAGRVGLEDFIIEVNNIEANDAIGGLEFCHKRWPLFFSQYTAKSLRCVDHDAARQFQRGHVPLSADFIKSLLRFEIEVNNVHG